MKLHDKTERRAHPFIVQDIMQSETNQRNRKSPLLNCCNLIKKPSNVPHLDFSYKTSVFRFLLYGLMDMEKKHMMNMNNQSQ